MVSAASGAVERVPAAGLKPLQGQPVRRGRPWRQEQWLWGKWVLLLFHILPGLSITLDVSMPRSSSLCSKCIPQLGEMIASSGAQVPTPAHRVLVPLFLSPGIP